MTGVELVFLDDYDVSHVLQVTNLADEIHLIEATESLRARLNGEYIVKTEEPTVSRFHQELNPSRSSDALCVSAMPIITNLMWFAHE